MKRAIRYLRFSKDGQSVHSIERQEMVTAHWLKLNNIQLVDTFIDEGYSATNFDRPAIKELFDFVRKNARFIDYLVVAELSRFSREAGDAINMCNKIQKEYGVRIVSAAKGSIYDVLDSASSFLMGLEFLLGNTENIKRRTDIQGGIYQAKIKGRYIHSKAPFGFTKVGLGKEAKLQIDETKAPLVRSIFFQFLSGVPIEEIRRQSKHEGFNRKGNSIIQKMLQNPVYAGYQTVKEWRDHPGGLFKLDVEPIIDWETWQAVQDKFISKKPQRVLVSNEYFLRGFLQCWCGKPLTGAASKGKSGKYFPYYNCKHKGHNTINVKKAHKQLNDVLGYMSLPSYIAEAAQDKALMVLEEKNKESIKKVREGKIQLQKLEEDLLNVESRFFKNEIDHSIFQKWHSRINLQINTIQSRVSQLQQQLSSGSELLIKNFNKLTDLSFILESNDVIVKQQILRGVFDRGLYYSNSTYRTPSVLEIFRHNELILKQKKLLIIEEKGEFCEKLPSSGAEGSRTPVQTSLQ